MKAWMFAIAIIAILLIYIIGVGLAMAVDLEACNSLGQMTNKTTKWELWNGCFVQVRGQWVPRSTWQKWE
jgi:hypothetical protein